MLDVDNGCYYFNLPMHRLLTYVQFRGTVSRMNQSRIFFFYLLEQLQKLQLNLHFIYKKTVFGVHTFGVRKNIHLLAQ